MQFTRRHWLRASGVALALPWLDALSTASDTRQAPRRLVCICAPLGLHGPDFIPQTSGRDYELSPHLEPLRELKDDFTVISGLSHPDVGPSHDSLFSHLTAAPHPEIRGGFRNSISFDQVAVEHLGLETRWPCLVLSCEGFSLSWTRSGAMVPSDVSPARVFARLFLEGSPAEVAAQTRRLQDGQSILDAVAGQAATLRRRVGRQDRRMLDEYSTSVRELEQRLARSAEWSTRPKPTVAGPPLQDNPHPADLIGKARLMLDLTHLALSTDATRIVTLLLLGSSQAPPIEGVSLGHHDLSHHGQDPSKLDQLRRVEREQMKALGEFLVKLKQTARGDQTLLDETSVFFGSNLGNANTHSAKNLPLFLAGGGFRHGQHLAFDPANPPPLSNLYVSLLQRLGVPADRFGSSTGTLTGLD